MVGKCCSYAVIEAMKRKWFDLQTELEVIRSLSKKFVQYVYKNFILQILGYINMVPFKILLIRHNTLVLHPFPLLEAPLEFLFS